MSNTHTINIVLPYYMFTPPPPPLPHTNRNSNMHTCMHEPITDVHLMSSGKSFVINPVTSYDAAMGGGGGGEGRGVTSCSQHAGDII